MPGLCGIVHSGPSENVGDSVAQMLSRMCRYPWHRGQKLDVLGASLGHAAVEPPSGPAPRGLVSTERLTVAFDGEIYPPPDAEEGRTPQETLAAQLEERGPEHIADLNGCFACAVWDPAAARMSIATDRFGMRPVYWTVAGGRFVFASEIQALLAATGVSSDRDEEGLAQFLAFGQYLGETTLYKHIKLVPAGSWLTFDAATGSVTVDAYAPAPAMTARSDQEWRELIDAAAVSAVRIACQGGGRLGLSLSGGLDARTILGLAPEGVPLTCVSLGIPGSIDHRAAAALARLAGQPHHALMLEGNFLASFEEQLGRMVDLTDGQYLDQGIVLTTLQRYRELGIQTLLRGHAGELMHMSKAYAFSTDAEALALTSKPALLDWLWTHLSDYMIGGADRTLFEGRAASRLRDMARAALERQVSRWDHVEPIPQRIWHLFVSERLRRETALSLQLFRNFVEVRVPFLDPAFVAPLLAAPPHLKTGDELQTFILGRHRPAFLGVVNANTGAPMGASPTRTRLAQLKLRLYSKLRVPGYQPYERLGLWLAEDLQPLLARTLLGDGAPGRDVFADAEISRLIDQHRRRERNHTFLLMALLILSLASVRPTAHVAAHEA